MKRIFTNAAICLVSLSVSALMFITIGEVLKREPLPAVTTPPAQAVTQVRAVLPASTTFKGLSFTAPLAQQLPRCKMDGKFANWKDGLKCFAPSRHRHSEWNLYNLGNVWSAHSIPVYATAHATNNGTLGDVLYEFESAFYESAVAALTGAYGLPQSVKRASYTNGFGAKFDGGRALWNFSDGVILQISQYTTGQDGLKYGYIYITSQTYREETAAKARTVLQGQIKDIR